MPEPYAQTVQVITDPHALRPFAGCAFVPTMGALHQGHATLVRTAAGQPAPVVVSIFVNPTQFNDPADLARYPRTLDADLALCQSAGAKAIFVPTVETIYPPDHPPPVPPLPAAATHPGLEDAHRPGHFAGVCQVVARLFDLISPASAYFGEKDYQQLAVIRAMATITHPTVQVVPVRTVREHDGLAMSSRNRFIPPDLRQQAAAISRALCEAANPTHPTPASAENAMHTTLHQAGFALNDIQYAAVRHADTLAPVADWIAPARALIAARLGPIRLIDNAPAR